MKEAGESELILILAPTENDGPMAARVLREAGLQAEVCAGAEDLCRRIEAGCAVIMIAEEALSKTSMVQLQKCLSAQEPWSDLPVILLTGRGPAKSWEAFSASGNISLLERPFQRLTMVRAVEVGLRARRKQYQARQLLYQQQMAAQKRDEFFATLSHELRTPLNVILGWTEVLRSGDLSAEAREDALRILDRNAQIQKALIDDLLDTSRIITGKLHFEMKPLSLNTLLVGITQAHALRAEQRGLRLQLIIPGHDCSVLGDEGRLSQVISNLLTNAMKFTPEGGDIEVRLESCREEYCIYVRDTGRGIDPDFLPQVFDRLKQEDMSTTRSHGGLGLGLAISAHIVEQHKGRIQAHSDGRDKGTEFTVTLPVYREAEVKTDVANPVEAIAKSIPGRRILVVDDSPDILTLMELWLKRTSAEIRVAHSAREALALLDEAPVDILISDIGMPEMDGYQLIARVRDHKNPSLRAIPAIALTAYARDEERDRVLRAGFQMHLSKPISGPQLLAAVYTATAALPGGVRA